MAPTTPGERYELRDPFSETVHHAKRFDEMAAKAEKLGSNRFTAIDDQGRRTLVRQVEGQWVRGALRSIQDPSAPEAASNSQTVLGAQPARQALPHRDTPDSQHAAQAERAARIAQLQEALTQRYVVKRAPGLAQHVSGQTEYRFRGDTTRVAFTESRFKLATSTNSPSVARSMVDVAEARQWKSLRVSGNEEFRRIVWLEASVRGVKTVGYEPLPADHEQLKREREARQVNRIEPGPQPSPELNRTRSATPADAGQPANKGSQRGGGRKAVIAAIEAVLIDRKVPEARRSAILAAAAEHLARAQQQGRQFGVKVYDKAAPSQRTVPTPQHEPQRRREPTAPSR